MMSLETRGSVAYSMMPLSGPSAAALIAALTWSRVALVFEQGGQVGDRAVGHGHAEGEAGQLALQLGDDLADGLGGPGLGGNDVHRGRAGAIRVLVDLVGDALVVGVGVDGRHQPVLDPERLVQTLAIGARQLVVHDALEMMRWFLFKILSLTPSTIVASRSSLAGALKITRSAPASMCFCRLARSVNRPVDSSATWQPSFFQGRAAGSFSVVIGISLPLTTMLCSRAVDGPLEPALHAVVLQAATPGASGPTGR